MSTKEWGNITWKFFHTLAAQIKEDKFSEIRDKLIDIVIQTCSHLPCPDCTDHASNKVLKRAYIKNIKTKTHFIEFLRQLHNIVNIKLYKKTYTMEEIKNMYTDVNLYVTTNQFLKIYSKQHYNIRLITHNMHRQKFIQLLIDNLNSIKYAMEDKAKDKANDKAKDIV